MKNKLIIKHFANLKVKREYIFIFLTATIFSFSIITKALSNESTFIVNNVEVSGSVDINFSREKYINKALLNSFDLLMSKILVFKDLSKVNNIKLREIKNLIKSFQILEESYKKEVDVINKAEADKNKKKDELYQKYLDTMKKLTEERKVDMDQLSKEKKKKMDNMVKKYKGSPDDLAKDLSEMLGVDYVE